VENGVAWMDLIASRIKSSHTYNENTAQEVATKIVDVYFDLFIQFDIKMGEILNAE